jgi:hypothetical protein
MQLSQHGGSGGGDEVGGGKIKSVCTSFTSRLGDSSDDPTQLDGFLPVALCCFLLLAHSWLSFPLPASRCDEMRSTSRHVTSPVIQPSIASAGISLILQTR